MWPRFNTWALMISRATRPHSVTEALTDTSITHQTGDLNFYIVYSWLVIQIWTAFLCCSMWEGKDCTPWISKRVNQSQLWASLGKYTQLSPHSNYLPCAGLWQKPWKMFSDTQVLTLAVITGSAKFVNIAFFPATEVCFVPGLLIWTSQITPLEFKRPEQKSNWHWFKQPRRPIRWW